MFSDTKILTSQNKLATKLNQKYYEYFLAEKLTFFKLLTFMIFIISFVGLLFFIISEQRIELIIFVALICVIYLILTFFSHRFKKYLVHILASMYMFSVATTAIIILNGSDVPYFLFGFETGIIFSVMIQFCDPKVKYFFLLTTPWIYLTFDNNYSLPYLPYILYEIIACVLLGLFSYNCDNKQKKIFQQNYKIEQQLEIIRHFTNDYLFAISYDRKQRQFRSEFTNLSFENSHPDDIKIFLRTYMVLKDTDSLNLKKNTKFETLEEFFFEQNKIQQDFENNKYFYLNIKNKMNDELFEMKVSSIFIEQLIFIIAIKKHEANIHFQKYEKRMYNLKESITTLSAESGAYLQLLYQQLNKVLKPDCVNISEICKIQQSNILYLLNRMKNYLMFYQKEKLQIISQSIECYKLLTFLKALLNYFQIKSSQRRKIFTSLQSLNFDQELVVRINQKLLTQILVNVFHVILDISSIRSIIRLSVTQEELFDNKKKNQNQNPQVSDLNSVNSKEQLEQQNIQFKFSFSSDESIENIEQLFCCSQILEQKNNDAKQIISSSVNNIILKIIGPYNQIYAKSFFDEDQDKYFNEVYFFVYTDQSLLDPSFTKHLQLEKQMFQFY